MVSSEELDDSMNNDGIDVIHSKGFVSVEEESICGEQINSNLVSEIHRKQKQK